MIAADWQLEATNWAIDPSFESGALRYDSRTVLASVTDSSQIVTEPTISSPRSLLLSATANASGSTNADLIALSWRVPAAAGEAWSGSVTCGYVSAALRGSLTLAFLDAGGSDLGGGGSANGTVAQVAPESLTVAGLTAPLSTASVKYTLALHLTTPSGTTGSAVFDLMLLEKSSTVGSYFDGDMGGCAWLGPRFYSASHRPAPGDAYAEILNWLPPHYQP